MAKSKKDISVSFSVTDAWLGGRDMIISPSSGEGMLLVSSDTIAWFVSGNEEGEELTWEEFSALIQEHGKLCQLTHRRT